MFDNAAESHCPFVRRKIVHAVVMTRVALAIVMSLCERGLLRVRGNQTQLLALRTDVSGDLGGALIPGHSRPYSDVADEVNSDAWQFMRANRL
jgi:hypothetical protein